MVVKLIRNNMIFDIKHYYANMLRDAANVEALLRREWENGVSLNELDDNMESEYERKSRSCHRIYNAAFAGLMWEGVSCQITKTMDFGDKERDLIVMFIDGVRYDCKAEMIQRVLREDYESVVSNCIRVDNVTVPTEIGKAGGSKGSRGKSKGNGTKAKEDKKLKILYKTPDKPEEVKLKEHLVMDFIDMVLTGEDSAETVQLTVAPLKIPETGSETVTDIIVTVSTSQGKNVYVSESNGRKSIQCKVGEFEFIVNGSWEKGKFTCNVISAGMVDYEIEEGRLSLSPADLSKVGFGHNVAILDEKEGKLKIHAFPLDIENNETGIVDIMICVEKPDGKREILVANNNIPMYKSKEHEVKMFGYWKGDQFIFEAKAEKIAQDVKVEKKKPEPKNPLKPRFPRN